MSLLFQTAVIAVLVVIGQAGTTTKGAYEVLMTMTLIPLFIPFLFLFGAAIKVQLVAEPGPGQMRTRWGRRLAGSLSALGLTITATAMVLTVIPPPDDPNPPVYVLKVVGLAVLLIGTGGLCYLAGKRRPNPLRQQTGHETKG